MRTVDEILRAMRGIVVNSGLHDGDMVDATAVHHAIIQYADELEEALKQKLIVPVDVWNNMVRKVENSGNAAALREALEAIVSEAVRLSKMYTVYTAPMAHLTSIATDALAAQPRNCDVGTALEQSERFMDFCRPGNRPPNCEKCKVYPKRMNKFWCQLEWAQMPYEAKEGGAK